MSLVQVGSWTYWERLVFGRNRGTVGDTFIRSPVGDTYVRRPSMNVWVRSPGGDVWIFCPDGVTRGRFPVERTPEIDVRASTWCNRSDEF